MKRKSLLMMLLCFAFFGVARAQSELTVFDGTNENSYVPFYGLYADTQGAASECVIPSVELGEMIGGTITAIKFYISTAAGAAWTGTHQVYLGEVDATTLTGITGPDAYTVVKTASFDATGTELTIEFDEPYVYGGGNLLIGTYVSVQGNWKSAAFYGVNQEENTGWYRSGATASGSGVTFLPKTTFTYTIGGGPTCEKPETLEFGNVTSNSAVLTWSGGSGTYNLEYKANADAEWTVAVSNTTATTYTLSGLTSNTAYSARVQSVCSGTTSSWKSVSFNTPAGIPLVEAFGTAIPSGWAMYSGLMDGVLANTVTLASAAYAWSFGSNNGVFDNHARVNIYGTGCTKWLVLPALMMENNVQLMFEVAYTAYSGTGAPAQNGDDDKFAVLINTPSGWEVLRLWDNAGSEYVLNDLNPTPVTVAFDLSAYAGQLVQVAFYAESTESNADNNLHIDNVSIDYIPACPKPTALVVNYEGGTTATVTWTGDATAYNIDLNGNLIEGITSPYTLTGLDLATTYEVKVQADCGSAGTSDWVGPVSFTTDACMPEDQCSLTFVLSDSYGDSWNGASIDIYDYTGEVVGDLLASVTISSGIGAGVEQTTTLSFCEGQDLAIIWTSGSYDSECSYTITDINDDVLVEGSESGFDGFAYTMDCTVTDCRTPSDFAASEIGPRSVVLSWTENGPATEWVIAYMSENDEDVTEITVNTNPYTLTGLTPETMYAAQVTPVCEVEKPSEVIYWTTDVACPNPTNLSVTPTPYTAEVTWNGFSEAYDIEWAPVPASTSEGNWLQYDNGTMASNVGNSTPGVWTWGVMYPADMISGNTLTKIAFYEVANSYYVDGTIKVNIYSGGDTEPGTLIGSETITTEGTNGMREVVISPIAIDDTQNLWIVFIAKATYCMTMSAQDGGGNSRWFLNDGAWADFGTLYTAGAAYSFMIRGFVDTIDYSTWEWTAESGVTSPYTITGLRPETDYAVRVKGNCGEDGESQYGWAFFTTPSACDMPIDLATEDITHNSATLNWTGYQESFNLQYRTAAIYEAIWEEDFENGLDDWTIVAGEGATYPSSGIWYTIDPTSGLEFEAHSGTYCASSWSWNSSAYQANNWLITPQLDLQGVLMYYVRTNSGYPDSYEVLLSTTDAETTSFTVTLQEMAIAPDNGEWNEVIIDLSAYEGQQGYIAIHHVDYDANYLVIDDFGVYRVDAAGEWETVEGVTAPYDLTGLRPETEYEWQIQGVNESCGELAWSEIQSFTTPEYTAPTEEDQDVSLAPGWNWWSSSLEMDATLDAALKDAIAAENTTAVIKNVGGNTMLENGTWSPDMALDNESMYMIRVDNAVTATLTAAPADPANHPITLASGWNWIGFPTVNAMTLDEAFAGITPNEEDVVKGTAGPATYTAEYGWNGSLTGLEPGVGYMYKNNGDPMTLIYPSTSKGMVRVLPMERYWMSDTHRHATTMTMLATLDASRYTMTEGNYEIGAFVGDECRGSARLQRVGSQYIAYLSVSGEEGETVRFKLYDVTNNVEQGLAEEQVSYVSNAITGTTYEPVVLHFRGTADVNESAYSVSMYPNPTKDEVMINGREIETVKVYNALGQLVYMEECGSANNVELHLNGLSAGVYTVNVRMANGQQANTMIVKQ